MEVNISQFYFNYIQRLSNNIDVLHSCRIRQYPFTMEYTDNKLKFLWIYKIINLLNYGLNATEHFYLQFQRLSINSVPLLIPHTIAENRPRDSPINLLRPQDRVQLHQVGNRRHGQHVHHLPRFRKYPHSSPNKQAIQFNEILFEIKSLTQKL